MPGPLQGVKVVDFTRVLAGPHFTKILLDLGASVLKIEDPKGGDISRLGSPRTGKFSHYFAQQNAGKTCVSIDLNSEKGRKVITHLVKDADVLAENFRPGTLRPFGFDYESVKKINPRIVYVSISGYGQTGPLKNRAAFAPTVAAETGVADARFRHTGIDNTDIKNMGSDFSHPDVYTGIEGAVACLSALYSRERTGKGQHIDVAMAATMLAVHEKAHAELAGMDDSEEGEPFMLTAPHSRFISISSGEVVVIAASPVWTPVLKRYARMMRRWDLLSDSRYRTPELRRKNFKFLMDEVIAWAATFRSVPDLEAQIRESGLALGELKTMKEFAESDWGTHWGAIRKLEDGEGGTITVPGLPWKFSDTECEPGSRLALRGMDNHQVLKTLGYSEKEIKDLYSDGTLSDEIA